MSGDLAGWTVGFLLTMASICAVGWVFTMALLDGGEREGTDDSGCGHDAIVVPLEEGAPAWQTLFDAMRAEGLSSWEARRAIRALNKVGAA